MNRFQFTLPLFSALTLAFASALFFLPLHDSEAGKSAGPARISKVNYHYLTDDAENQKSLDPMVRFERRHLLHGANTLREQQARYGSYFTVFWNAADRSRPVTIRFEYRLQKTGPTVKSIDREVLDIKRKNTVKFSVIGDAFANGGKVSAWRATVLRDGEALTTYESFLWD